MRTAALLRKALAAAGAVCLAVAPGSVRAAGKGTAGADFLKIASGVRAVSMGNSYVAVGEDVYSLYWNPSGIASLEAPEAFLSYVNLFSQSDVSGAYLITGAWEQPQFPFGTGNFGAGLMALTTGSFDSTDPAASVRAAAGGASDAMVFASYAGSPLEGLSTGVTLKLLRRSLAGADPASAATDPLTGDVVYTQATDYAAQGAGVDVGAMFENLDRTWSVGGAVQNLGEIGEFGTGFSPKFGGGAELLPILLRVGGALRTKLWGQQLLATGDVSSYFESIGKPRLSVGAEYGLLGLAFFRLGWEQPLDAKIGSTALDFGSREGLSSLPSPLRTGFGVRLHGTPLGMVQFDYALAPFGTLGVIHQAALLVRWSIPKIPKAVTTEAPVAVEKKASKSAMTIEPKQLTLAQPAKEWKIEVTDDRGRVVKTFTGAGTPPKSIDWDGTDERGKVLTNLKQFNIVVKAKDITNKEVKATSTAAAVSAEPSLKAVAGKPLYPEVVFVLPQGNYQLWQVQVQDAGRLVRQWEGQGRPDQKIKWDGRDAAGQVTALSAPRFKWQFVDQEGQKSAGEKPLPQIEAAVQPETLGNKVRMVGVRFRGRNTDLTEDHLVTIEKASKFIGEHPDSSLTIESYADVDGDDEENYLLAKTRAEKVLQTLSVEYNVQAARLSLRVYGRSKEAPRYPNLPEEEQKQRVDLIINVRR